MALRRTRTRIDDVMKRFLPAVSLFLMFLLISPSMGFSQVQTRVRMIEASNIGAIIDPSLKDVHSQLGSLFNFTSYRLLKEEQVSLAPNRAVNVPARQETSLEMTLMKQQKDAAEVRVKIRRSGTEILNTQVRLSPGRTVLIGGPKHGEGIIILAISSSF